MLNTYCLFQVDKQHFDKSVNYQCDTAVSLMVEYSDESSVSLTGTIFGCNTPTLLQVDDSHFTSPVPLIDKLCLFSASPSQILGKMFEKFNETRVMAMHSTWNGASGITVLKIDGDVNYLTNIFQRNQVSIVSF